MPWQAAQDTALLDTFFEELGTVPTASSRMSMGGGGTRVAPAAFRGSKRGQSLQVSAWLGWSGSVVLHGLCFSCEAGRLSLPCPFCSQAPDAA